MAVVIKTHSDFTCMRRLKRLYIRSDVYHLVEVGSIMCISGLLQDQAYGECGLTRPSKCQVSMIKCIHWQMIETVE